MMKVDQSSANDGDHSTDAVSAMEAGQMLLNQLREITGIQNSEVLHRALKASQGDIGHAVGLLTTAEVQDPGEPQDVIPNGEGVPKDELQAAIELSLRESKKALEEEREFNRALEASAEETTSRVKRKRSEVQNEICSPADWIRMDDWPVGIRNVGNTCWFSAVIQSLFHLPVFRRLVLGYSLTEQLLEKCKSHSDKRNIAFMQELRCLFALMVASTRRFVDPSAAVELLRDAFRTNEAQQDVSEFSHKLLDWLEDAFQLAANGKNPEDKLENPMVQLFYGTFVTERRHEGKTLSNIEQFGQYPLQVNGYNNLDECLEGAMVEKDIESLHSDQTSSPSHERWFSKLPPVLTFELSRFEFNAQLGRPEKIHKKLEFPQIVYMDRYLHKNIAQTHGRRGDVKRLKEQLAMLQQKLECYKNYGSGPTKYPLADMLQYVLEFATTKPTSASPAVDLQASSPTPPSQPPTDPLSEDTSHSQTGGDTAGAEGLVSSCQRTPIYKPFTQCRPPKDCTHPAPHSVSEEELHSVKSCLQRWRTEAENNINELKASIDRVSQTLEGMYTDNSLCQVPYRLHAVLVHEGQASAGHYWAYIYDHANQRWMKYNDISISESTWEELMRESYGGMTNASAYCLMYIDDSLPSLIAEDTDDETGQVLRGADSLPPVLKRYVHEDNRWFQQELSEWEEQFCQQHQQQASHQGEPIAPIAPTAPAPVVPPAAEALLCRRQTRANESTEAPSPPPAVSEPELYRAAAAAEDDQTPTPPETEEEPNERLESPELGGDDAEERFHTPDSFASQTREEEEEEEDVPDCGESDESHSGAVAAAAAATVVTSPLPPLGPGQEEDSTSAAPTPVPEEGGQQGEHQPSSHTAEPGSQTSSADVEVEEESEREVGVTEEPYSEEDSEVARGTLQAEEGSGGVEPRQAEVEQEGEEGVVEEGEEEEGEDGASVRRRRRRRLPAENEVSEVDIPNVGRIMVRADADGYNEESMLTPAMQGVILAIAKARQTFDTEGPEAGLIKAFHEEYCRLYELSQEEVTLQEDPRLQHSLVYFFQNKAPNKVVERTLLEQFTDRNLSFDDRAISIMREARSKLRLIKPEDMDMDEYLDWHDAYRLFRKVFVYLLTGLEQYQHGKVREALTYLAHAHKNNAMLLRKGERRGVDQSIIALYRRKCLTALNESAAQLFCGGEDSEVEEGMAIMNDAIIPCLHLMGRDDSSLSQEDLDVMENIRSHWCSCLGQDMNDSLQEKLGEFLPRVLDGSAEMVILKDPPKVHVSFPHDLCSRLTAVMESIHNTSIVIVK